MHHQKPFVLFWAEPFSRRAQFSTRWSIRSSCVLHRASPHTLMGSQQSSGVFLHCFLKTSATMPRISTEDTALSAPLPPFLSFVCGLGGWQLQVQIPAGFNTWQRLPFHLKLLCLEWNLWFPHRHSECSTAVKHPLKPSHAASYSTSSSSWGIQLDDVFLALYKAVRTSINKIWVELHIKTESFYFRHSGKISAYS